jgi:CheY-like chemotaxis protein
MAYKIDPATRTVLIIEDNSLTLLLLESHFQKNGFAVVKALDGQAGLDACQSQSFDLILIDLNIPLISGRELIAKIRKTTSLRQGPAYAMSAGLSAKEREELGKLGFTGYLQKPVKIVSKTEQLYLEGQS